MKLLKLLYPGMHLKRWLLVLMAGMLIFVLGVAYLLVEIYRTAPFPEEVFWLTLQFLPRPVRAALFATIGPGLIAFALWKLNRSLIDALAPGRENIVDAIYNYRARQRGPKVVAIGGGTGLSMLLRGLKDYTSNITAIVTVGDDGGSSGRLRRDLGILPPGDFRNCLVALADVEPLMAKLFQYRFDQGSELDGHSFGNLFLVAMMGVTGSFERALRESSRVLAVRGQVLPSTLVPLTLRAELDDAAMVEGESKISQMGRPIRRLYLEPAHPPAYPEAIKAILEADLVVLGPGSLFTSLLPNLLVEGIYRALLATKALRVYVCNVATQRGETDGFGVREHVEALRRHLPEDPFDYVLANSRTDVVIPERYPSTVVTAHREDAEALGFHLVLADVVDPHAPLRHEPAKLAQALIRLYYEKAEPLPGALSGAHAAHPL
ncbi:MAG TPA: gluconeogenesis factor YvcK family protein [Chloroflexota bacterium]|jgi:uncharacterized cofD-like protein|nr:gluconeogenesis factor YvcK family protein [Chloroflexota bacterium]